MTGGVSGGIAGALVDWARQSWARKDPLAIGFLASLLFDGGDEFQPASFVGSLLGAILLLFLARKFRSGPPVE